jgi:hypothetical protein
MIYPIPPTDLPEWEELPIEMVELSDDYLTWAVQQSQTVANPEDQWQRYLQALGVAGLREWLAERAPDLAIIDCPEDFLWLRVGPFMLQLLVRGSLDDAFVHLPDPRLQLTNLIPEFCVLVTVLEEQMQIQVSGYVRQEYLQEWQSQIAELTSLPPHSIPLRKFTLNPDALLLELRCLQPQVAVQPTQDLTQATPMVINVALWLRDRLDAVAQELFWVLLPAFTPATAGLRSAIAELDTVMLELSTRGITVPPEARGAYHDILLSNDRLRLYAITWSLTSPKAVTLQFCEEVIDSWRLLLVLGTPSGDWLPGGIQWQVRDAHQLLSEQITPNNLSHALLYTEVEGDTQDAFCVTIIDASGVSVTLPPLTWRP